ncbi:MAG: Ig-like domain-containing protein [Thermoplasmatota archaeon]
MLPLYVNEPLLAPAVGHAVAGIGGPSRSSQTFHSPTGGKWVYDFSEPDPASTRSQNLTYRGGLAVLKERFLLDDFTGGTVGQMPSGWTEDDPSEGDFVLDSSVYRTAANSAHYSTASGGGGYAVSRTMTSVGSSDNLEVRFSIWIVDIKEVTTNNGLVCRLHYSGLTDGAELRFHDNGTVSLYGWDGSGNREFFSDPSMQTSTWYEITLEVNMSSQTVDLIIDGQSEISGAPLRSQSGGGVLFMNSISFISGPSGDGAEFHIDDIFATKNTIDSGRYTSPTISKTGEMEWQYLQVYPGSNEDLLSLSLIDISSGSPFANYDRITVPSNGRISLASLSNSISNFKIDVRFVREGSRRPSLDLVGASWQLTGHFFDPLFPGTGLLRQNLEHVTDGLILEESSPGNYKTSGKVITHSIDIGSGRVWGVITMDFQIPDGTNLSMEIVDTQDETRIPGIPVSYNGALDLFENDLPLDEDFRIKITFISDGLSTPNVRWISLSKPPNTAPVVHDLSTNRSSIYRMQSTTLRIVFGDGTDKWTDLEVDAEYQRPGGGPWSGDMITGPEFDGTDAVFRFTVPATAEIGTYKLRAVVTDRSGIATYSDPRDLEVMNNLVTMPLIELTPDKVFTDTIIRASLILDSSDPEGDTVLYRFYWYINGELNVPEDWDDPLTEWVPENTTSKSSTLAPSFTKKGDNISCKVIATDQIDDCPPAWAWAVVNNSPPSGPEYPLNFVEEEDTVITIDLLGNFSDKDEDDLVFSWTNDHTISIEEIGHGMVNVTPMADLNGEVRFNISASDGGSSIGSEVTINYIPVNDPPYIEVVSNISVKQGQSKSMEVIWGDAESGPEAELEVILPKTWGSDGILLFDRPNSTLYLEAENGNVGSHIISLTARDKQGLEANAIILITVENINDPLEAAVILWPLPGDRFEEDTEVTFQGNGIDPDTIHGQELVCKWFIVTEEIGTGKEITHIFEEPGTYTITLEVSEGSSSKSTSVEITITKKGGGGGGPDGDGGKDDENALMPLFIGAAAAFVILVLGLVLILLYIRGRKKKEEAEKVSEEEQESSPETAPEVVEGQKIIKKPEREPPSEVKAPSPMPAEPRIRETAAAEIQMPPEGDILLPDDIPPEPTIPEVSIPQVEEQPVPETVQEEEEEEDSGMEYYSPTHRGKG